MMMKATFILTTLTSIAAIAGSASAQDSEIITGTVERTIEPTNGGGGAEVTFESRTEYSRDLSIPGNHFTELDTTRKQTVETRGDRTMTMTMEKERGDVEVTVEVASPDRVGRSDKPEKPERPR
jgi:hypothetical protein